MAGFDEIVYEIVSEIPEGKVASYGQIAAMAGKPRAARMIGNILHRNPDPVNVPCHRVVNRDGRLAPAFAFGGAGVQAKKLAAEGVAVSPDGFVDMAVFGWQEF
ncbi:MAG: MGMT family protein [Alphaproteobacteria bacterium]|nr:MGMT family protein [Alphaproteobacteria bacterium]